MGNGIKIEIVTSLLLLVLTCNVKSPHKGGSLEYGTVADIDGNLYTTIKVGNQEWTVENLRTTKYNDGSMIPLLTESAAWFRDGYRTTPEFCYYKYTTNADSIKKFGALYNWYVVSPANPKKIAPAAWQGCH